MKTETRNNKLLPLRLRYLFLATFMLSVVTGLLTYFGFSDHPNRGTMAIGAFLFLWLYLSICVFWFYIMITEGGT
jgi:hypothetical protein